MQYLFGILLFTISLFLILLVLVQRGRGGGLAGAFGGMGGQSAFGTKAGDLFTRVTMIVAAVWILLSIIAIAVLNSRQSAFGTSKSPSTFGAPAQQQGSDAKESSAGEAGGTSAEKSPEQAGSGSSSGGAEKTGEK